MDVPPAMNAAVTTGHGGPEAIDVLGDWPTPRPGPGQALVKVTAAALNNTDIWSREGSYGTAADPGAMVGWRGVPLEFPLVQGIDMCGEVVEVGSPADRGWLGRRVLVDPIIEYEDDAPSAIAGSEADGGFAQFHLCSSAQLHDVSASSLTDAQLACLPCAYGTALGMLNRAACAPGERVLVTGASGGVGLAALHLLTSRSCEVVARTSAPHAELLAAQGATEVSVRGRDSPDETDRLDAMVDVVGGPEFAAWIDRLRVRGRAVVAGAVAGPLVQLDLRRLYLGQRRLIGSTMHTSEDFSQLANLAADSAVEPMVAAEYPLSRIHEAQERFSAGDFVGKIVLRPWQP